MRTPLALQQDAVEATLTSPGARMVLAHCIRKAVSAREVGDATGIAMASVYRHLHTLLEHGLLVVERSALTPDGKPYDLYRSRVRAAHLEVRAQQVLVTWELNAPVEERIHDIWRKLGGLE